MKRSAGPGKYVVSLRAYREWRAPRVLSRLDETTLSYGAAALTAITDNAALTYLGSLVEGVSEDYKYALVGFAILKDYFDEKSINALGLFAAALPPTFVAVACFRGIKGQVGELFHLERWMQWFGELDRAYLFLLILPFVVAAVGLWAEYSDRRRR